MKLGGSTALVVCLACGAFKVFAPAQTTEMGPFAIQQFSATMVMTSSGRTISSGKMYRSGNKLRTDSAQMGPNSYFLFLSDEHTGYLVMGSGRCMQMPQTSTSSNNPFQLNGTVERKAIGSDTVDGHPTTVEQVTVTTEGKTVTMKVWEARDLNGFPVQIEMPNNIREEFKDVSLFAPAASLFDKPHNCTQLPTGAAGRI